MKWQDIVPIIISILVAALQKYSKLAAAVTATMPLTAPLALWVVYSLNDGSRAATTQFAESMLIGVIPTVAFLIAVWLAARAGAKLGAMIGIGYGAWTAVLAAKLHHRPVIVRAGYLWGNNFTRQQGNGRKAALIRRLERFSFTRADRVVVTTPVMERYVVKTHGVSPDKTAVIPNYVDTNLFRPLPSIKKVKGRICFVGRLTAVKNLDLLIEALAPLEGVALVLIGEGNQRPALEALAQRLQVDARFLGRLENRQLPEEINRAEIFILLSKFEGHPKALIEAMGCGTAVIGTNVEGINTVINHNDTGLLCQPTVESICNAVQELLANPTLRLKLGRNAHQFALQNYALDHIIRREMECYRSTIAAYGRL